MAEIGSEFLCCVSVVDGICSDYVSGVKIKTVLVKSNNFFSKFRPLRHADSFPAAAPRS
jgi:hypothetical protein